MATQTQIIQFSLAIISVILIIYLIIVIRMKRKLHSLYAPYQQSDYYTKPVESRDHSFTEESPDTLKNELMRDTSSLRGKYAKEVKEVDDLNRIKSFVDKSNESKRNESSSSDGQF